MKMSPDRVQFKENVWKVSCRVRRGYDVVVRLGGSQSRTMRAKSNGTRRYRSMNVVGVAGRCAKTVYGNDGTRKHGRTGPMINAIVHHAYGHVREVVARARFPIARYILNSMLGTPWNQIPAYVVCMRRLLQQHKRLRNEAFGAPISPLSKSN